MNKIEIKKNLKKNLKLKKNEKKFEIKKFIILKSISLI